MTIRKVPALVQLWVVPNDVLQCHSSTYYFFQIVSMRAISFVSLKCLLGMVAKTVRRTDKNQPTWSNCSGDIARES
jgi:hypothetical protein